MIYTTDTQNLILIFRREILVPFWQEYQKKILLSLSSFILFLWIGTSWGFFRLPFVSIKAMEAISENTALILETQNHKKALAEIESTPYADDLFYISILEKWKKDLRFLDSLFQATKTYRSLLDQAHIVSGVQISSRDNADWLFSIDNYSQTFDIELFLKELMPQNIKKSTYRGQQIYKLYFDNGQEFSFAFFEELIVASPLTILVESGIEQLDNISNNVARNSSFNRSRRQQNITEGKLLIHFNFKTISLLTGVVSTNQVNSIAELGQLGEWVSFDAQFLKNGCLFSSHFYPAKENLFLQELAKQTAPEKTNIAEYLPKNMAVLLYLGWSDINRLYQSGSEQKQADFEANILPWLGQEAALVIQDPIDDKNNFENDFLVFLQAKDTALARLSLLEYGKINTKVYQNFDINQLPSSAILQPLYGRVINPIVRPFYTIVGDYVIFANSYSAIKKWVEQYNSNQTLQKAVEYEAFLAHSKQKSTIYILCSTPKSMKFLQSIIRDDLQDYFKEKFYHFRNIYPIGIQFYGIDNHFLITVSASHHIIKEQVSNQNSVAWAFEMNSNAAIAPKPLFDAVNQTYFILAQDSTKQLYFINNNGQNLWKDALVLPHFINSDIFEIDFYNNGEMQLAFSTSKSIYMLNKEGVILKKIDLVTSATAGLLVIDYGKGPRFFIPCRNGGVYGFDQHGKPLNGWQPKQNVGRVDYPLRYLEYQDKQYLLTANRKGVCKAFKRNSEIYFKGGKLGRNIASWDIDKNIGRIVAGNQNGKIQVVNTRGKSFSITAPKQMKNKVKFAYADVVGDSRKDYIRLANNQLAVHYYQKIKNKKGKLVDKFTAFSLSQISPQQQVFGRSIKGKSKEYIGTLDSKNNTVSLFDAKGKLQNGFPLSGTSKFEMVDLFNENGNTLIVANNNSIYAYKIKL